MTATQIIKSIKKAGIDTTSISKSGRNEIEIWTGDEDGSHELMIEVTDALGIAIGGYKTGYGAWCLSEKYQSKGDWNDKSSRWHY